MSSDFYDDDNYDDGFGRNERQAQVDLTLWRQLFAYTLAYPKETGMLVVCAFCVAISEVAFPLITREVIDAVEQRR